MCRGLSVANTLTDVGTDCSSAMSNRLSACRAGRISPNINRCYNTPQAYKLGWLELELLDGSTLQEGATKTVSFAAQTRAASSPGGLKVTAPWVVGQVPLFFGYRLAEGNDAQLLSNFSDVVNVYSFSEKNYSPTTW